MPRISLVLTAVVIFCMTGPAWAQQARATGTVRDTNGRSIKGATVRAVNREASPPEITSTTDDRGRFAMIGLRSGEWTFLVEAPGFTPVEAQAVMRVAGTPPMVFTLARDPGPIPGALDRSILQKIRQANTLRDKGQYDQALAAYQEIRAENPKLTSLNMVMAGVYRRQAAEQADPVVRRTLLERAISTYTEIAGDEATGERARAELESTRAEVQALPR